MNASVGYGNYNAAFITLKMSRWHGLTLQSNFTYGKALGTGSEVQATSQFTVPDAYNLHSAYGLQPWDRKFLWNVWLVYEPSFYKNQHGLLGHIAGGWSLAPIITVGSGLPLEVQPTDAFANEIYGSGQSFGEGDGGNFAALQNAILICPKILAAPATITLCPANWAWAQTSSAPACSRTQIIRTPVSVTRSWVSTVQRRRCRHSARHALLERGLQR